MDLLDDFELSDESFSMEDMQPQEPNEEEFELEDTDDQEEFESEELEEDLDEEYEESSEEDQTIDAEDEEYDETSYSGLVSFMVEQGLIPEDLDLEVDDSPEGLAQVFEATLDKRFDDMLSGLSPKAQALLQVELNGGDIEEAFQQFDDVDYTALDLDDEDVRREVLTDYYKTINPKWTEVKVEKMVDAAFDSGDDEDEAREAQEFFVEKQEETKQEYIARVQAQREEQEEYIKSELNEYHGIIDSVDGFAGIPFSSKKEKEEFRSYLFDKGKDGLTQAERDDADKTTRLAKEYYKFKKFSFETIEKKATTKAVVNLKKIASRHSDTNARGGSKQENTRKGTGFSLGKLDF